MSYYDVKYYEDVPNYVTNMSKLRLSEKDKW